MPSGIRCKCAADQRAISNSGLQQLVALFSSLQPFDTLLVHLFGHFLIPLPLFLGCPLVLDGLYSPLKDALVCRICKMNRSCVATHLTLILFLGLHLLLDRLDLLLLGLARNSLRIIGLAGRGSGGTEWLLWLMPLLSIFAHAGDLGSLRVRGSGGRRSQSERHIGNGTRWRSTRVW